MNKCSLYVDRFLKTLSIIFKKFQNILLMRIRKSIKFSRINFEIASFVILFSVILFWMNFSHANIANQKTEMDQGVVPAPLLKWPKDSFENVVLVDKTAQKVYVYNRENVFSPVMVYSCSTGENDGRKSVLNDRKTPEGIYFFTKSFEKKDLSPIYGTRAFPLNYPNSIDKREGRGGYGIWFHGLNKPLKPKDTNGCIAFENKDINELAQYIELNNTPVIISSNIKMVSPEERNKEAEEFVHLIDEWRRSWEEKKIDQYISFYHRNFFSSGKNREQWRQFKQQLTKKYRKINVGIKNLRVLKNNGLVLAEFIQEYQSDRIESSGVKRLYFKKNSRQWKIFGEYFIKGVEKKRIIDQPVATPLEDIKKLVFSWVDAWTNKDLQEYISFYDQNFRSRGMNLTAWKKHKARINNKYYNLQIRIDDIEIKQITNNRIDISFKLDYQADDYRDFGFKRMRLIKKEDHWKIVREEWISIKK